MPTNTYVALDKVTLTGTASSVTFSSIPNTYTDLRVIISSVTSSGEDELLVRFNGDTATNYSDTIMGGNGSTASSNRRTNAAELHIDNNLAVANGGTYLLDIMNYANTTTFKTILARFGRAGAATGASVNLWRKTPEAINSISFSLASNLSFGSGSTFSLYGIKADTNAYTAKATGGTITADTGYIYHTFTSSGNFVPTTPVAVEYFAIAGGGGGGSGGGGAGGLIASTATLSSSTAVTVGAGGAAGSNQNGNNSSFNSSIAIGGGGGGADGQATASSGGCGGGAGRAPGGRTNGGTGSQGGNGGYSLGNISAGGGGGGISSDGGISGGPNGGAGGDGTLSYRVWATATSTGVSGYYGGGGGGAANGGSNGGGGAGGGGAAGATAGTTNTGSGGGAHTSGTGAAGGSGIVIIRYPK